MPRSPEPRAAVNFRGCLTVITESVPNNTEHCLVGPRPQHEFLRPGGTITAGPQALSAHSLHRVWPKSTTSQTGELRHPRTALPEVAGFRDCKRQVGRAGHNGQTQGCKQVAWPRWLGLNRQDYQLYPDPPPSLLWGPRSAPSSPFSRQEN